jgi:hypothetical protein
MSQLQVSAAGQPTFYLNVLSMYSPIQGEMNSGQTRSQIQYFPTKAGQPNIAFTVVFPTEQLWETWQAWVRQNMLNAQKANTTSGDIGVTLNWPQRSIHNWSGVITDSIAGGWRWNVAPRVNVEIQLVNSLVSNVTTVSSFGNSWQGIFFGGSNLDGLLALPELIGNLINVGSFNSAAGTVAGNNAALSNAANALGGLTPSRAQ